MRVEDCTTVPLVDEDRVLELADGDRIYICRASVVQTRALEVACALVGGRGGGTGGPLAVSADRHCGRFHVDVGQIAETRTARLPQQLLALMFICGPGCHKVIKDLPKLLLGAEDALLQSHSVLRLPSFLNVAALVTAHFRLDSGRWRLVIHALSMISFLIYIINTF